METHQGDKENGEVNGEHNQGERLEARILYLWWPICSGSWGSRGFSESLLYLGGGGAFRHLWCFTHVGLSDCMEAIELLLEL